MDIKLLSKNKYLKVPLFLSGGGGGVQMYDYLLLPKTAYIDTNVVDTNVHSFTLTYIPVSLVNSYQNYISSRLDNFTLAYFLAIGNGGRNYLRISGQEISRAINFEWGNEYIVNYNSNNYGFLSVGDSGENIIINNNTSYNRGAEQKFIDLELEGNNNYHFVPAAMDGDVGIYEMNNQIFIAASGTGAEVGNF